MEKCVQKVVKWVRILLLVLSVLGWTIFSMGLIDVVSELLSQKNNATATKKLDNKDHMSPKNFLSPMFLFFVSGLVMYVLMGLHILVKSKNSKRVLHSSIMCMNTFYLTGGGLTIMVALLFVSNGQISTIIQAVAKVPLDHRISMKMLTGGLIAVGFYWLSTFLWPLTLIKRRQLTAYQELQQMSHEEVVWD